MPFCVPRFPPLPALAHLPKHLCVWQARELWQSPDTIPFPPQRFSFSFLTPLPTPSSSSPLYSDNLFSFIPFGFHLSLHLYSLYISVFTLTSVKLPFLFSHLSSVLLSLSLSLQSVTTSAHPASLPFSVSLVPLLTSNIKPFSLKLSCLIVAVLKSILLKRLPSLSRSFEPLRLPGLFLISQTPSLPSVPSVNPVTLTCLILHPSPSTPLPVLSPCSLTHPLKWGSGSWKHLFKNAVVQLVMQHKAPFAQWQLGLAPAPTRPKWGSHSPWFLARHGITSRNLKTCVCLHCKFEIERQIILGLTFWWAHTDIQSCSCTIIIPHTYIQKNPFSVLVSSIVLNFSNLFFLFSVIWTHLQFNSQVFHSFPVSLFHLPSSLLCSSVTFFAITTLLRPFLFFIPSLCYLISGRSSSGAIKSSHHSRSSSPHPSP